MAGLKELVEHKIKARDYTERVNHLEEGKSFYSLDGKDVRIQVSPDLFYKGGNIGYEFYGYDIRAITGEGDIGRVKVSYGEANLLKDGSPEDVRDLLGIIIWVRIQRINFLLKSCRERNVISVHSSYIFSVCFFYCFI